MWGTGFRASSGVPSNCNCTKRKNIKCLGNHTDSSLFKNIKPSICFGFSSHKDPVQKFISLSGASRGFTERPLYSEHESQIDLCFMIVTVSSVTRKSKRKSMLNFCLALSFFAII